MYKSGEFPPAFDCSTPKLSWLGLTSSQQHLLKQLFPCPHWGKWKRLDTSHQFPFGYYQCYAKEQRLFIKIVSPDKAISCLKGEEIVSSIVHSEHVNPLLKALSQLNVSLQNTNIAALVYPFISTRLTNFSNDDISQITTGIAQLHHSLYRNINEEQVATLCHKKLNGLIEQWIAYQENTQQFPFIPSTAKAIFNNHDESFLHLLTDNAQIIHGDLNVGNVLFNSCNKATFIDFENTPTSYFSVLFDLAYISERFFVKGSHQIELKTFLQIYIKQRTALAPTSTKSLQHISESNILTMQKIIPFYCLLILLKKSIKAGELIFESEWHKFIKMYERNRI